jgi:small subunit ribosomal protein S8
MTMTDPIADMLTRIRNALKASQESVDVPSSKLKINLAKILKSEGFIKNFKVVPEGPQGTLRVFLKYDEKGTAIIGGIKRVSKPSRRVYAGYDELPPILNGYGVSVLSTSRGLMTDKQARRNRIGGEVLCAVW